MLEQSSIGKYTHTDDLPPTTFPAREPKHGHARMVELLERLELELAWRPVEAKQIVVMLCAEFPALMPAEVAVQLMQRIDGQR